MTGPRLAATWAVVLFALSSLVAILILSETTRRADDVVLDAISSWRAPKPDSDIIIVEIDQTSLDAIGRWPWPRSVHAKMLDQLNAAGANAIIYDVLFVESGQGDDLLAQAMASRRNVYLPMLIQHPGRNGQPLEIVPILPEISSAARRTGAAPILYDQDGLVRRAGLSANTGRQTIPHIMELAYRDQKKVPASRLYSDRSRGNNIDPYFNTVEMAYAKVGSFPSVPFSAVLSGEVPAAFLKGKTVLVGATALGMTDSYPVPWSAGSLMPGIEIQANLYSALGNAAPINFSSATISILASILPIVLLLMTFWYLPPRAAFRLAVLVIFGWILILALAFIYTGLWIPPVPGLIGLIIAYPLWGWRRLEALSNWVGSELREMNGELGEVFPLTLRSSNDRVGAQVDALGDAIETLKTERQFTRDILEASPDALIVEDEDGKICYANQASDQLFGVSVDGWDAKELGGGKDFVTGDHSLPNNIVSVRVSNFDDPNGDLHRRIIRLADVTEIRKAEAEREAVLQFLSHDMRAPQSAIIALLNGKEGKEIPEALHRRIERSARQTLNLADGFVRLARALSAPMEEGPFDMADLMREAADLLWSEAQLAGVIIAVADADEVFAVGDAAMLMRALVNVIGNAIKYSPPAGTVRVEMLGPDDGLGWQISDEGPGFVKTGQRFTPFSIGKSSGVQLDGIGLGLAFVETATDRHGGKLVVKSRKAGGSVVTITITSDRKLQD